MCELVIYSHLTYNTGTNAFTTATISPLLHLIISEKIICYEECVNSGDNVKIRAKVNQCLHLLSFKSSGSYDRVT
jgi:hypothetical protein